jgi:hypothetical protein
LIDFAHAGERFEDADGQVLQQRLRSGQRIRAGALGAKYSATSKAEPRRGVETLRRVVPAASGDAVAMLRPPLSSSARSGV